MEQKQSVVEKNGRKVLKVVQTRCVIAGCNEPPVEPFTTCKKHHSGDVGVALPAPPEGVDSGECGETDVPED